MTYIPTRMCVACRTHKPPSELIRIAYNKVTDMPFPDTAKKSDGRGAYICKDEKCIARARKKHVIEHHLKCPACDGLYTELEGMI